MRMFQRLALEAAFEKVGVALQLPGFQSGGIVPGPEGKAQPAIVHGGEYIVPVSERKRQEREAQTKPIRPTFDKLFVEYGQPPKLDINMPDIAARVGIDYGKVPQLQAPDIDKIGIDYGRLPELKAPRFDDLFVHYGKPPQLEAPQFDKLAIEYGDIPRLAIDMPDIKAPEFKKLGIDYGKPSQLIAPQFDRLAVDYGEIPRLAIDMPDIKTPEFKKLAVDYGKPPRLEIPGFQSGGIVPGPINQPQLIVAHGGEEVVPVHGRERENVTVSQNINFNISALDAPSVQQLLKQQRGTITAVVAEAINDSDTIRRLIQRR